MLLAAASTQRPHDTLAALKSVKRSEAPNTRFTSERQMTQLDRASVEGFGRLLNFPPETAVSMITPTVQPVLDSQLTAELKQSKRPLAGKAVKRVLLLALVLSVAVVGGGAVWSRALGNAHSQKPGLTTEAVKRGPLEVKIIERGNLESAANLTLRCMVEGATGASILKIAEEGSWVEKDQVLVELDSSRLRDEALAQQVRTESAAAALKTAETNVAIQQMQNESDVAATELKLKLARLDVESYKEGDHPQARNIILGEIAMAHDHLEMAEEREEHTTRLMKRGFSTTNMLEADRVALKKSRIDLETSREKQRVLDEFTYKRDIVERDANVRFYERELVRIRLRAEASMSQRERNLLAAKRSHFIEKDRYDRLIEQIAACTIRTPRAGMVVHANTAEGGRGSNVPLIYEGAVVRERQALINVPDLDDMQVTTRIHESKIGMMHDGLTATVHVDALPGESFYGVVNQVALVPNSGAWPNFNLKEYTAHIKLSDEPGRVHSLKPGMTAEVEILVDRLESVLQAPVQSCIERGGRFFAWVLEDDEELRRHEVSIGKSNDKSCEIVEGLQEGDEIVMHPRTAIPDEVALLEHDVPLNVESFWPEIKTPDLRAPQVKPPEPASEKEPAAPLARTNDIDKPTSTASASSPTPAAVALSETDAKPPSPREPTDELRGASTDPMVVFNWLDQNHDAKVTEAELPETRKPLLSRMDTNGDKAIDKYEWTRGAQTWTQRSASRALSGGGQ